MKVWIDMFRLKLLRIQKCVPWCSKLSSSNWSSANVRNAFLNYFSEQNHLVVPSKSIIPAKWRNVQPLPFVNAGMVSWRPIFMNEIKAPQRFQQGLANSQRWVAVGNNWESTKLLLCSKQQIFNKLVRKAKVIAHSSHQDSTLPLNGLLKRGTMWTST